MALCPYVHCVYVNVCLYTWLPMDRCVCVCVCVITTRAGCIREPNGCIIGDVPDTALSVGVSSACCPDSNYCGSSGEVRQAARRRRPHRLILSADGWFCLGRSRASPHPRIPASPHPRSESGEAGDVASARLTQKTEIVSCQTLFVIFDI